MKTITDKWLEKHRACPEARRWVVEQDSRNVDSLFKQAINQEKYDLINWYLIEAFTEKQLVEYAIYCAELCLPNYEKIYDDKLPREAINAAKVWLKNPTKKNQKLADSAAERAESAAWNAVWSAEGAACSVASSIPGASWNAAWKKILNYGFRLLTK